MTRGMVNQIVRHRDQHNTQLKQNSSWSHPHRIAQSVQSDQSTWASSPGPVSSRIDDAAAPLNLGPRTSRT